VTSSDNYQSKINTLLPNTSIVVNTTFTLGGEVYNRGDIVYKKENGEEIHIHSQSGGIYEPSIVKSESENNNVSINYIYSDVISSEPITATFNINSAGSTYTQYNKIDGTEISDFIKKTDNGTILTTVYKITYTLNNTINDLKPIAKIFLVNEDNVKEEAYADIKITEGSIVDDKNVTHNVWKIETPIIKDGYLEVK
jgi:hypothetical protein